MTITQARALLKRSRAEAGEKDDPTVPADRQWQLWEELRDSGRAGAERLPGKRDGAAPAGAMLARKFWILVTDPGCSGRQGGACSASGSARNPWELLMDPLSLMAAGTGMGVLLRLADAGAEWCTLRARTRLAETVATLPPGTEMGGSRRSGATWFVRVPLSIAQVQATQADTGEH